MAYSFAGALRQGTIDHAGIARFCREAGVRGLELMDSLLPEGEDTPAILDAHGLECCCYDVSARLAARGADEAAALKAALTRAARCGAPRVLVVPGEPESGDSPEAARDRIVEGLCACADLASHLGIAMSLEHRGAPASEVYGSTANLLEICRRVGGSMGATCDVGNCMLGGERPDEAVRRLGPRIVHVHLKDWAEDPAGRLTAPDGTHYRGAALGDGVVDLAGAQRALAAAGYAGWASVEYEGADDARLEVARGVRHARSLFGPDR